jgi:hypothetical protein
MVVSLHANCFEQLQKVLTENVTDGLIVEAMYNQAAGHISHPTNVLDAIRETEGYADALVLPHARVEQRIVRAARDMLWPDQASDTGCGQSPLSRASPGAPAHSNSVHSNSVDAAFHQLDTALDHLCAALGLQHAA